MSEPLKFHPIADIFPLMQGEEFDALVADIKGHGLRQSIDCYEGQIVDGRNRYRALQRLEENPEYNPGYFRVLTFKTDKGVLDYIISKNIHRRHLTPEQKREIIAKVIAAKPEASDRQIAKQVKTDHKTVGSVRAEREATGEISPVEKRVGADGKARKQPAKKVQETGETGEDESRVAEPDEIKSNFLDTIDRHAAVVRAYKKVFAVAALNQAQKDEISAAIRKLITKWTSLDRTLAAPVENAPPPDVSEEKKFLNAVGKPISPSYDPKRKRITALTSINRLYASQKGIPLTGAPPVQADSHVNDFRALRQVDEHVFAYGSYLARAKKHGRPPGSTNKPKSPPVTDGDSAPAPEVGAEIMKAKLAALDNGADPGPMPEIIRRTA